MEWFCARFTCDCAEKQKRHLRSLPRESLGSGLHGTQAYLLKQTNNTFPTKGKRKAKDLVALEVRKLSFSLCVALGLFGKGVSLFEYWDIELSTAKFESATHFPLVLG